MVQVRRSQQIARIEMTPLIDVIFLLLTFFIYGLIMMRPFEVLPVTMVTVETGHQVEKIQTVAITMDRSGSVYFNRQRVTDLAIEARLRQLTEQSPPPQIIVAMEADLASSHEAVDRGPLLLELIQRLYRAGISDYAFAGPSVEPTHSIEPPDHVRD